MGLQKIILNIVLKIEAFFISFFKIKNNRITFISLEADHLVSDFLKIYQQLPQEDYDIRLCLIHYHKNLWGQFLYFINCMKQLYYVYTSRIIFLHDNNYVVSHFKEKAFKSFKYGMPVVLLKSLEMSLKDNTQFVTMIMF